MEKAPAVLKKTGLPAVYIACIAVLDQIVKNWAVANLQTGSVPVVEDVFYLTYAANAGAAWSILSGSRAVLLLVSFAAFALIAWMFRAGHMRTALLRWSMYSVVGGALGNLWDRLFRPGGLVVDLFDFSLIRFPIFNVADIFITVGGGLFILAYVLDAFRAEKEKKREAEKAHTEDPDDPA